MNKKIIINNGFYAAIFFVFLFEYLSNPLWGEFLQTNHVFSTVFSSVSILVLIITFFLGAFYDGMLAKLSSSPIEGLSKAVINKKETDCIVFLTIHLTGLLISGGAYFAQLLFVMWNTSSPFKDDSTLITDNYVGQLEGYNFILFLLTLIATIFYFKRRDSFILAYYEHNHNELIGIPYHVIPYLRVFLLWLYVLESLRISIFLWENNLI